MTKIIKRALDAFKLRRIAQDSGRGRGRDVSRIKQKEMQSKIQTYKKKDFTILNDESRHVDQNGLVRDWDKNIPNPDTRGKSETNRQSLYEVREIEKRLDLKPGTISLTKKDSSITIKHHGAKEVVSRRHPMQPSAEEPNIASIGHRGDEGDDGFTTRKLDKNVFGVIMRKPLTRNGGVTYKSGGGGGSGSPSTWYHQDMSDADTPLHIGSREFEGESDDVLRKPRIEATGHIDKQIEKKTKQLNNINQQIIKDQDFVDRMHYLVYEDSPGPVNIEHLAVLTDDTHTVSHGKFKDGDRIPANWKRDVLEARESIDKKALKAITDKNKSHDLDYVEKSRRFYASGEQPDSKGLKKIQDAAGKEPDMHEKIMNYIGSGVIVPRDTRRVNDPIGNHYTDLFIGEKHGGVPETTSAAKRAEIHDILLNVYNKPKTLKTSDGKTVKSTSGKLFGEEATPREDVVIPSTMPIVRKTKGEIRNNRIKAYNLSDDITSLKSIKENIEPDHFYTEIGKGVNSEGGVVKHQYSGFGNPDNPPTTKVYEGSSAHRKLQAQAQRKLKEIAQAKKDAELKVERKKPSLGNLGMLGGSGETGIIGGKNTRVVRKDSAEYRAWKENRIASNKRIDDMFEGPEQFAGSERPGISPREFMRTRTPEDMAKNIERSPWINRRIDDIAKEEGLDPKYVHEQLKKHGGVGGMQGTTPDDPLFNAVAEPSLRNMIKRIKRGESPNEPRESQFSPEQVDFMKGRINEIGKKFGIDDPLKQFGLSSDDSVAKAFKFGLDDKLLKPASSKQKPFKDIITPKYMRIQGQPWGATPKTRPKPMGKTVKPFKIPDPTFFARQFMAKKGVTRKRAAGYGLVTGANITGAVIWGQQQNPRKRPVVKKRKKRR